MLKIFIRYAYNDYRVITVNKKQFHELNRLTNLTTNFTLDGHFYEGVILVGTNQANYDKIIKEVLAMQDTRQEIAEKYLKTIIRNLLASKLEKNPSEISMEVVNTMYESDSVPGYHLHHEELIGYVNGKKEHSISVAIIDKVTGEYYYSNIIHDRGVKK